LGVDAMPGDPEQPLLSMQDLPGAVVLVVQHGRLSHIACSGHDTRGGCRGGGGQGIITFTEFEPVSRDIQRYVEMCHDFLIFIRVFSQADSEKV